MAKRASSPRRVSPPLDPPPSAARLQAIRQGLLAHYDRHARDLPWRRRRDPYAIWVSEIMLQQTRVETVLRYYDRFLARFPDATALAAAHEDEVLAAWSGLGYYRRARLLHSGVREVVARYGGAVPEDVTARRALPGIGRYTAGAIGSIAFDRAEPLVDGNVARVFSRLFEIETPLGRADTQARLWDLAERIVVGPRPGALNQALMELGATLCSKAAPGCGRCPVAAECGAHASGRAQRLPVVTKKAAPREQPLTAAVVLDASGECVLLQRAERGLFAGLWNLPMAEVRGAAALTAKLRELGVRAQLRSRASGVVEHVLTHRRLRVAVFLAELEELCPAPDLRLQPRARLDELGVSRLTLRLLEHARGSSLK
jgi:A/G-specific adenine glycosylase